MRILYILDFFHPHVGGVPTFFKNLCENMARLGHKVTIVTTHANGTKSAETYRGMKILRFGRTREQFMLGATMFLIRNREKYDVVHTSTYSAMIPSYAFSVFKRTPEVLSVHEVWSLKEWTEFTKSKGLFYFLEERLLFVLPFDMYIVPSMHTRFDLEKIGVSLRKIKVIPHGIDRDVFNPSLKKTRNEVRKKYLIGKDEVVGCFVGKATVFKGIDYLLDALEIVLRGTSMKFIFLLSRSHESGYKKFMSRVYKSETLRKNIIMAEPSHDQKFTSKIVAASDFLVMPSLTEGFGLAAAEAASMGIPVIATKETSLTEVVDEGENAIFVKPRSANDIARAMKKLARDKKLIQKLSRGKKFPIWKEVAQEYVKAYQDAIRKHKEVT